MGFFDWFRKSEMVQTSFKPTRAKGTKKTFKLVDLDICLRWVRCRACGGKPRLILEREDRIAIMCGCGQTIRLIVVPVEQDITYGKSDFISPTEQG